MDLEAYLQDQLVLVPVEVPSEVHWVHVQVQALALEQGRWELVRPALQQAGQLAQQVQH